MKEVVLVFESLSEQRKEEIKEICKEADVYFPDYHHLSDELLERATVFFGNVGNDVYKKAKSLKWMQTASAGVDGYFKPEVYRPEVMVTNCSGAYGLPISEHMVGCVFAFYKNLFTYKVNQPQAMWKKQGNVKFISGSTVLCLGTGDIGRNFAIRMKALGAHTIGIKRTVKDQLEGFDELYTNEHLDELLPKADIVALSMPRTKDTYHMLNKERIALMKKDALIVNVGRGDAIDSEALYEAMNNGHLLGAALDVFEEEPLPKDHPFWQMNNILVTPHVSGGNYDEETGDLIYQVMKGNLIRYFNGQELYNQVDPATGYKVSNS